MARKGTGNQVGHAIQQAIEAELKEMQARHDEDVFEGEGGDKKRVAKKGDFKYALLERMRVYDRALKLESLKLKAEDPEWGAAFGKKKGESGENE